MSWERSCKLVEHERQLFKFRLENDGRNCAIHAVVVKEQLRKIRESSKLGGDAALEIVVSPTERRQRSHLANFGWNGALEFVHVCLQELHVRQATEFSRSRAMKVPALVEHSAAAGQRDLREPFESHKRVNCVRRAIAVGIVPLSGSLEKSLRSHVDDFERN